MKLNTIKSGDVFPTNESGSVIVISYNNSLNVLIEFLDENKHQATVQAGNLRKGKVDNPYRPSSFGVGYLGAGIHRSAIGPIATPAYTTWRCMLSRCYCDRVLSKFPTYKGCSVYSGWHNFQSFAEWYEEEPNSGRANFHLDKDLRKAGNKVYSPKTCSFVPQEINKLLGGHESHQKLLPQGVRFDRKKFAASLCVNGKQVRLGSYLTAELAHEVYRNAKTINVRSMAKEWREYLHPEVYDYLKSWTVA